MKLYKTPRFLRLIFKRRTWGFYLDKNAIYLTFDDGPHPDITPWILDLLKEKNLVATFFCVGENVVRYPEIYQRIVSEGHAVGNHTMRHLNALKVKPKEYLKSIEEAQKVIQSKLFRPPYGRLTPTVAKKIRNKYSIVMWSWLSYDFDQSISIEKILEKGKKQIKGGDILVLHDNPKITERQKILLPALIELLSDKKFNYKTLTADSF